MDRLSDLPDELLLGILSLLPTTDVVTTMVLSKRWKFLWTFVPRLEYDHAMYQDGKEWRFSRFVYSSLLLHEAPVLEHLSFILHQKTAAIGIGVCVRTAIKRSLRKLQIVIDDCSDETIHPVILPSSLYTGCRMLVTLVLSNLVLMDSSSTVCFPSLKSLVLVSINYPTNSFVPRFLSGCPVLENLFVERCLGDNGGLFVIRVACLKVLSYRITSDFVGDGFLIDAPSLELMDVVAETSGFCGIEHNMPKIEVANVLVHCSHTKQILSSLTSLEKLELCLMTSKDAYPEGIIFSRLVELTLCTCGPEWLNLLLRLLKDSPKLRNLKLQQVHRNGSMNPMPSWNEPSDVPRCLLSSLETVEWSQYEGREEEIEVVLFILRNSARLKMATFHPKSTDPKEKLEMLTKLSMSPRSSTICHLNFGRGTFTVRDLFYDHRVIKRLGACSLG
ncbi:unnamed protein product [Microthlaspi erraticum]|uniref:F-box domain-containing protein n=1 Tax=Microthlaspi erraticum TaxID=1685480 RepID=A0A6D2L757_9BRAS|nr:unnamed protein product [Microthlaspi erraticum]